MSAETEAGSDYRANCDDAVVGPALVVGLLALAVARVLDFKADRLAEPSATQGLASLNQLGYVACF